MTRMTRPLARPQHLLTLARLSLICALGLTFFGALAGDANAATSYCVVGNSAADCPAASIQVASIPAAVAAASADEAVNVYVTSGTQVATSGFDLGSKPIRLIGVGPSRPVITSQVTAPGGAVIQAVNSLTHFENLSIGIAASAVGMTGIRSSIGGQSITDVNVNGQAATASTGIEIAGSHPSLTRVEIVLDGAGGSSTAISAKSTTTTDARLHDITISAAGTGIDLADSTEFEVRRARISAADGLRAANSTGTISSSLITLPAGVSGTAIDAASSAGAAGMLNVYNCTLVHPGNAGGTGVRSAASGDTTSQEVLVDSSIVSGFGYFTFFADAGQDASAQLDVGHSWYNGGISPGVQIAPVTNRQGVTNFGFVNDAAGDYRLRMDSPLVDAGNPIVSFFNQADSETDLAGNPRIVARKGGRVRDVGAYEVQNAAPSAVIDITTSTPTTTAPTRFTAARSTDPDGDALSYEWSFDSVPSFGGVTAAKHFLTPGPHTVRLSVSDSNGSVSHTMMQFDVAPGFLKMTLDGGFVRLSSKGTFKVTISCPAEAVSVCNGRLVLQSTSRVDAARYKKKKRKKSKRRARTSAAKYLTAADFFFRIDPGATRTIELPASKTVQSVLAAKKRLKITGVVSNATTINANLTSNRGTWTLLAPRSK